MFDNINKFGSIFFHLFLLYFCQFIYWNYIFFILFKLSLESITHTRDFYPNIFWRKKKNLLGEPAGAWIANIVFYKTLIVYIETIAFSIKRHHCFTILLPVLEQSVPAQSRNKVEMQFVPILFLDIWDEETPSAATLILFIQISLLILKKML